MTPSLKQTSTVGQQKARLAWTLILASVGLIAVTGKGMLCMIGSKASLLQERRLRQSIFLTPIPRRSGDAVVAVVSSFASPPVTYGYQLTNEQAADGCFPGLRTWSKTLQGRPDLVSQAYFGYSHVKQTTLEFQVDTVDGSFELDNFTTPIWKGKGVRTECSEDTAKIPNVRRPCSDLMQCHIYNYFFRYADVGFPEGELLWGFNNDCGDKWSAATTRREANKVGFRLVGNASVQAKHGTRNDFDHVLLFQNETDLSCVMAVEGSESNVNDWMSNFNMFQGDFCGFGGVHRGLSQELRHIVNDDAFVQDVKAKLPSCSSVHLTGHSKGGGLINLIAACANRATIPTGRRNVADYEAIVWQQGTAALLPEI